MSNKALALLAALILLHIEPSHGQQSKVYQVVILSIGSPDLRPQINGFRDALREAGYTEGKNLILDVAAKENSDQLPPITKAYIERKFDVIVLLVGQRHLLRRD